MLQMQEIKRGPRRWAQAFFASGAGTKNHRRGHTSDSNIPAAMRDGSLVV
jgi:hypothetical protein